MLQRVINGLLIIALAIGIWFLVQSASRHGELSREYARLAKKAIDLPVKDPRKIYIRAVPTGEPLHFAWRVYLPKNHSYSYRSRSKAREGGNSTGNLHFFLRYRIHQKEPKGIWQVFTLTMNGESGWTQPIQSPDFKDFLESTPELIPLLQIKQLGSDGPVELDLDRCYTLLKISRPPGQKLPPSATDGILEFIRFGPSSVLESEKLSDPLPPE